MKDASRKNKKVSVSESSVRTHKITPEDAAVMTAMRAAVLPLKGKMRGTEARESFDGIMERISPPENVAFRTDTGWPQNITFPPPKTMSSFAIRVCASAAYEGLQSP
jgi:hypothetical protein